MKRVIPAASLLTLGAASIGLTVAAHAEEGGKSPWTLSANVDGFYDNNVYTRSGTVAGANSRVGSFGLEFSPTVSLEIPFNDNASKFLASYTYALRYYDSKSEHVTHSHQGKISLDHKFSDIVKLGLSDSLTYSQDPAQNAPGGAAYRTVGDNLYNVANAKIDVQVAPLWDVDMTYQNTFVKFQDASLRAQLDRMEHLPGLDLRYQLLEATSVMLGYQYRIVNYDNAARAADGNLTSHRPFVGIDNSWSPSLRTALRVGAEAITYDKGASTVDRDSIEPYFDGSVTWDYTQGGAIVIGANRQWAASDVYVGSGFSDPSRGKELTTAYVTVTHSITPDLTASVSGGYQWGKLVGGAGINAAGQPVSLDGQSEDYAYITAMLSYKINAWVSTFAAYSLDLLSSSSSVNSVYPGRDYDRSIFKLGVNLTY